MAYKQGRKPMQYTQPEAEGSFDHSHQKPGVMQQTQLPQQRTPNYNQNQQIRSCESSATMAYMQSQEPMQYTQPEVEGSFDYSQQQQQSATQQTQPPQQGTPNYNQKQQVRTITQYTVNSDNAQPMEHQQYNSTFPALPRTPRAPLAES